MTEEKRTVNSGDILHIVQIAILLASVGVCYEEFQQTQDIVGRHSEQLNRIEHYLSSKDSSYWRRMEDLK